MSRKNIEPYPTSIISSSDSPLTLITGEVLKGLKKIKVDNKIKIVYFGTPDFSAQALKKLLQADFLDIQAVITNPDSQVGRKQLLLASPVAKLSEKYHIPTLKPEIIDEEFIRSHLSLLEADVYVIFSYGKILPARLLNIPKLGSLNIHGSLLPKYRGTAPIQAAFYHGDQITGVTIMLIDEKMDHGPILGSLPISLTDQDTFETVSIKMSYLGTKLLLDILPKYVSGKLQPKPQDNSQASYTWKRSEIKQAAFFDLNNPPKKDQLDRMIRAFYPGPNAWTLWQGKVVKFYPNQKIQIEGKKIVSQEEFLRGYPKFPLKGYLQTLLGANTTKG